MKIYNDKLRDRKLLIFYVYNVSDILWKMKLGNTKFKIIIRFIKDIIAS